MKAGDKVVPTEEAGGRQWQRARELGQPYLYVLEYRETTKLYFLTVEGTNTGRPGVYRPEDLRPYEEPSIDDLLA